jgi:hypothetical protein
MGQKIRFGVGRSSFGEEGVTSKLEAQGLNKKVGKKLPLFILAIVRERERSLQNIRV